MPNQSAQSQQDPFGTSTAPPDNPSPPPPKSRMGWLGNKKIVPAILGVLLLVGAVGAGVVLVQQRQEIREEAAAEFTACEILPIDAAGRGQYIRRTLTRGNLRLPCCKPGTICGEWSECIGGTRTRTCTTYNATTNTATKGGPAGTFNGGCATETSTETQSCSGMTFQNETVTVEKFGPLFDYGCKWGEGDNLGMKDNYDRARREEFVDFTVPEGCTLDNLKVTSEVDLDYDDNLLLLLDGKWFAGLDGTKKSLNRLENYTWDKIKGHDNRYHKSVGLCWFASECRVPLHRYNYHSQPKTIYPRIPAIAEIYNNCVLISDEHWECTFPISINLVKSDLDRILSSSNPHTFGVVVTGDNDPESDCGLHENVDVTLTYACPAAATPTPTPSPSPTPTPVEELQCIELELTNGEIIQVGDTLTATCTGISSPEAPVRFDFRYSTDGGQTYANMSSSGPYSGSADNEYYGTSSLTVNQSTNYQVQCRLCKDAAATVCTEWGMNQ